MKNAKDAVALLAPIDGQRGRLWPNDGRALAGFALCHKAVFALVHREVVLAAVATAKTFYSGHHGGSSIPSLNTHCCVANTGPGAGLIR